MLLIGSNEGNTNQAEWRRATLALPADQTVADVWGRMVEKANELRQAEIPCDTTSCRGFKIVHCPELTNSNAFMTTVLEETANVVAINIMQQLNSASDTDTDLTQGDVPGIGNILVVNALTVYSWHKANKNKGNPAQYRQQTTYTYNPHHGDSQNNDPQNPIVTEGKEKESTSREPLVSALLKHGLGGKVFVLKESSRVDDQRRIKTTYTETFASFKFDRQI